ncbi:hypothetical protein KKG66_01805, partial [bacterium]|nr:hypothetical protein [bacterium]
MQPKHTSYLSLLLLACLLLAGTTYATDYAPDTLWTRTIEIEGFPSLTAKRSIRTPDGGLLIGCDRFIEPDSREAILIKLDADYNVAWHSVFTNFSFQSALTKVRVRENGDYDFWISYQYPLYRNCLLHMSDQADSLDLAIFPSGTIDAIAKPDGGYIVLSHSWTGDPPAPCNHEVLGLDAALNVQWRVGFEGWGGLSAIERTENGLFIVTGFSTEEIYEQTNTYFHSALLNDQGVVCLENTRILANQNQENPKTSIVGNEFYSTVWYGYFHLTIDDLACLTSEYSEANMFAIFPEDRPEGLVPLKTNDGGIISCGQEFRCISYASNGAYMWTKEYDLDNDENESPHIWKNDYAVNIYQEIDNSYLIIGNDYTVGEGSKPVLICIGNDPPQGYKFLGNDFHETFYQIRTNNLVVSDYGGYSYRASWNSWGVEGNVKIELSRHFANGPWEVLAANTPNDGSQALEYNSPEAEYCYLKISSVDDTVQSVSDWRFSLLPFYHKIFFQAADNPGIYPDTLDFGEIELGLEATRYLSNWSPQHSPYLFNIRQDESGPFTATSSCSVPGELTDCLIEVSIIANQLGSQTGVIGLVTNAQRGDSFYYQPGHWADPDSALTLLHVIANVTMNPRPPVITLTRDNEDAVIDWNPVLRSIAGYDISGLP